MNRRDEIRTMLQSLLAQSHPVSQVVIVNAGKEADNAIASEFPTLNIRYVRHLPPSAAEQRNVGVAAVEAGIDLIGFLDDDATLEADAVERMLDFWAQRGRPWGRFLQHHERDSYRESLAEAIAAVRSLGALPW